MPIDTTLKVELNRDGVKVAVQLDTDDARDNLTLTISGTCRREALPNLIESVNHRMADARALYENNRG